MKNLIFAFLAALPAAPAGAAQIVEREMICPVCGTDFYTKLDVPDPDYEMRLDLKPLGAIPGPWRLPECPKCNFVIYAVTLPARELALCKAAVASTAYLRHVTRSSYYKAGVLYGMLGKPDYLLANTFLKASWQEEPAPSLLREDLDLSLKHFTACAASCKGAEKENSQLMTVELLRRTGRFGEARAQAALLRPEKGFQNNFFSDILDFQIKLCDKRDAGVHDMLEVKLAKLSPLARFNWYAKKYLLELKDGLKGLAGK